MEQLIFDSLNHVLAVGLIVALGQLVYAATGFGAGLISISLLALFFGDIDTYVPFFLLLCLPTETWIVMRQRKRSAPKNMVWLLAFIIPTLILGGFILKVASDKRLILGLGVLIVVIAVFYLFFEDKIVLKPKGRFFSAFAGATSGMLGSLYGMGGPPLIIYFKSLGLDKNQFRMSLLTVFFAMSLIRLVAYSFIGLFDRMIILSCAIALPFALLGLWAGNLAHRHIAEATFKQVTSSILLISGILVVIKGL